MLMPNKNRNPTIRPSYLCLPTPGGPYRSYVSVQHVELLLG
jgi:hypothetical protein